MPNTSISGGVLHLELGGEVVELVTETSREEQFNRANLQLEGLEVYHQAVLAAERLVFLNAETQKLRPSTAFLP